MSGKSFREMVGGLTYDNPFGLTPEEKGQPKVGDMQAFKMIVKDLKVRKINFLINSFKFKIDYI